MIPYFISISHLDHNPPYRDQQLGSVTEEEIEIHFLNEICNFILKKIDKSNLTCEHDIKQFFDSRNSPWHAHLFRNDKWEYVTPTVEQIWERIQLIKLQEQDEKQDDDDSYKLLNEESNDMGENFKQHTEENPLSTLQIEDL